MQNVRHAYFHEFAVLYTKRHIKCVRVLNSHVYLFFNIQITDQTLV